MEMKGEGMTSEQPVTSFETKYPMIAEWITTRGWIEIGQDEYSRSMIRALDEGGMVWEGNTAYTTMDDLFDDLEKHLSRWLQENG